MRKVTITSLLLLMWLFTPIFNNVQAEELNLVIPSFEKVEYPVPDQDAYKDRDNQGDEYFGYMQFYHIRDSHAAWGDYNNDGKLDVFFSGRNDHIDYWNEQNCFYENLGDGEFKLVFDPGLKEGSPLRGAYWSCPMWFDFNNDGYLDLLIGGVNWGGSKDSFSRLYQNMGPNEDGEFIFEEVPNAGGIRRFMNEDGGGKSHQYISVGDFDKDGYVDVVVTGFGWNIEDEHLDKEDDDVRTERMVRLYKNNGDGTFTEIENPLDGNRSFNGLTGGSVHFVDLDRDGWLDIVSSGYGKDHDEEHQGGRMFVYWNNGDGTFSKKEDQEFRGTYNSGSGVFDVNNDGYFDIVISGESPKDMFMYINNGDRTFEYVSKEDAGFRGHDGGQFAFGDVNNDGLVDILVGGHYEDWLDQKSMIYLNKGDGTFQELSHVLPGVSHGSQSLIDFDNDGKLDAFLLGWTHQDNKDYKDCAADLMKNITDMAPNQAPSQPADLDLSYNSKTNIVTLSWEHATDDTTPQEALRYNIFFTDGLTGETYMTLPADLETGFVKVGEISGQVMDTSYSFMNTLVDGATYTYGVQAIDNGNRGGEFAKTTMTYEATSVRNPNTLSATLYANNGSVYYEVEGGASLTVYDVSGNTIRQTSISGNGTITGLNKGFYIVKVEQGGLVNNKSIVL